MVGDDAVVMEIFEVAGHVCIANASRVINDEASRVNRFGITIKIRKPLTMFGIAREVGAPVLVDQRPRKDGRMMIIAFNDAVECYLGAFLLMLR